MKGPSAMLRGMVVLAPLASGLPVLGFVVHHYVKIEFHSARLAMIAAVMIAASLGVTLLGASAVLRLAWAIARQNILPAIKPGVKPIQTVHRSIGFDARQADHCA